MVGWVSVGAPVPLTRRSAGGMSSSLRIRLSTSLRKFESRRELYRTRIPRRTSSAIGTPPRLRGRTYGQSIIDRLARRCRKLALSRHRLFIRMDIGPQRTRAVDEKDKLGLRKLVAAPTASGLASQLAVAHLQRRGIDPAPLLIRAGLSPKAISGHSRIPGEGANRVPRACVAGRRRRLDWPHSGR